MAAMLSFASVHVQTHRANMLPGVMMLVEFDSTVDVSGRLIGGGGASQPSF